LRTAEDSVTLVAPDVETEILSSSIGPGIGSTWAKTGAAVRERRIKAQNEAANLYNILSSTSINIVPVNPAIYIVLRPGQVMILLCLEPDFISIWFYIRNP
jgi:hypothetical protein